MIVEGPASQTYPTSPITIGEQLRRTVVEHGDRQALVAGDRRMTWREVGDETRRLAAAMVAAGVEPGDRVALWLPNRIEWGLLWLAAARVGAVVVPVNSRFKHAEAGYILRQSGARLLFMQPRFLGIDYTAELGSALDDPGDGVRDPRSAPLRWTDVVSLDDTIPGTRGWAEFRDAGQLVPAEKLVAVEAGVPCDAPTIIVYTSGTTGRPKGAVHTHGVLRNVHSIAERLDVDASSVILGHMPLFHVAGAFGGMLVALVSGASLVHLDHWDVDRAIRLIEDEHVSVMGGIATHFIDLLAQDLETHDVSSLRSGWIGGSTNPPEVIAGALDRLGMAGLLPVYGMTETAATTTMPEIGDDRALLVTGKGRPISDFQIRVCDLVTGGELDAGAEGEVCVRGHSVTQGYFRDEAATAAAFDSDGWFHTGDIGVLDVDGYLSITGRRSDMFIVGGSNAYPAEIELAISDLPDVKQVCVVGVPHPRLGEVGYAFVELHDGVEPDESAIRADCRRRLANYKVPEYYAFVRAWPVTDTGKIARMTLKREAEKAVR